MRGIRPNLCWCTSIEDSNSVDSAGRSVYTSKWVTIWFSASWILTSLPNSLGLLAFPLKNNFRVRLEHTHDLFRRLRLSCENPYPRLSHHLPNPPHHGLQRLCQTFHWSAT